MREAYIVDPEGRRRADFAEHNLHLVAHSTPVRARMSMAELRPHLHSIPDDPRCDPLRALPVRGELGLLPARPRAARPARRRIRGGDRLRTAAGTRRDRRSGPPGRVRRRGAVLVLSLPSLTGQQRCPGPWRSPPCTTGCAADQRGVSPTGSCSVPRPSGRSASCHFAAATSVSTCGPATWSPASAIEGRSR